MAKLLNEFVLALFGALPPILRRSRFVGMREAVQYYLLPEFIHGLYSRAYRRWIQAVTKKAPPAAYWDHTVMDTLSDARALVDANETAGDDADGASEHGSD